VSERDELVDTLLGLWAVGEDWMVLGGGSNSLISDEGVEGTVIRIATRGVEVGEERADGTVLVRVQAGEPWDALVARTVADGLAGLEALSGIPGSTGASPVQNIGAYGQEVADVLEGVDLLDYETGRVERLTAADLGLGYRTSSLKRGRVGVVLSVDFALTRGEGPDALGLPVAYPQLAGALGVELGDRVPVARVRETVLALRASKGMVLDDADPDTWSAGSFFTNPIVSAAFARTLPADAPRWPQEDPPQDLVVPLGDAWEVADAIEREAAARRRREPAGVKLSAAWLIEHSGVHRGFRLPGSGAAVSSKHTLALTNRGTATAEDVAALARYVQGRVMSEHGVILQPEPVLVGLSL
jgi:UDP-N-acetylmuramate dehydrogenase